MNAYDKTYLEKARTALGRMLDFATYDLHFEIEKFWDLFLVSGIADRFADGDFSVLVGKSGIELAYEVLEKAGIPAKRTTPHYSANRSEEYWTGWALAYYQWENMLTFSEITGFVSISEIRDLYHPYHEMDIRQFCDEMRRLYKKAKTGSNLKLMRKAAGLSQKDLADLSGVSLRTIQQYEQGQKNINKASAERLMMLSQALNCDFASLLEPEQNLPKNIFP